MAEGEEKAQGPNLAVSAIPPPPRPASSTRGGTGGRSLEAAPGGAGLVAPNLRPQVPLEGDSGATRGRPCSSGGLRCPDPSSAPKPLADPTSRLGPMPSCVPALLGPQFC